MIEEEKNMPTYLDFIFTYGCFVSITIAIIIHTLEPNTLSYFFTLIPFFSGMILQVIYDEKVKPKPQVT